MRIFEACSEAPALEGWENAFDDTDDDRGSHDDDHDGDENDDENEEDASPSGRRGGAEEENDDGASGAVWKAEAPRRLCVVAPCIATSAASASDPVARTNGRRLPLLLRDGMVADEPARFRRTTGRNHASECPQKASRPVVSHSDRDEFLMNQWHLGLLLFSFWMFFLVFLVARIVIISISIEFWGNFFIP